MLAERTFVELLAAVRAGDEQAATELVRRYEPAIRRWIHGQLIDRRQRRLLETMDICQSVLGEFFARVVVGQFDLESPEQLVKLLAKMATNKLIDHGRRAGAEKRSTGEDTVGGVEELPLDGGGPTPSRIVAGRELVAEFRARLSDDERAICDERAAGRGWGEIAAMFDGTPDAARMRWQRTVERVASELGWDASLYV